MRLLRTLLASLAILAAGLVTLSAATDGFRAYTTETARRLDVREHPRAVPDVPLQVADGRMLALHDLRGRWLLVDFIYTRCTTYCSVLGSQFAQLQQRLAAPIAEQRLTLLSISFDPAHDGPAQLAAYQQRARGQGSGWIAARTTQAADLDQLLRTFGVIAIPDGLGGFVHNAAITVVDPHGRLVEIIDWDDAQAAERYVLRGLAR